MKTVVNPGDDASKKSQEAVQEGNKTTEHTKSGLVEDGKINTALGVKSVINSIDGVGTKVQIYSNAFEGYIKEFEAGKIELDELKKISIKIWKRMFHDLIAMNVDDLRKGEMGVVFTNILDINKIEGFRGEIFADTFPEALKAAIKDIGINGGNGEIAILGESAKFAETLKDTIIWAKEELKQIDERREARNNTIDDNTKKFLNNDIRKTQKKLVDARKKLIERANKIEFNLGGTAEGVEGENEKLVEMKPGQRIIVFSEKATAEGIISPRSNGITRIRELMHNLAGANWEMLTFEEFLEKIGEEKANLIPNELKKELTGLRMWDIATGETTVFNQFISKDLLGGLENEPIAGISALLHITGNPLHKIANGLDDRYTAKIDASKLKKSQIIKLLQYVGEENGESISDESARSSWNYDMPYAVVVDKNDVEKVLKKAKEMGYIGTDVGEIIEKDLKDYNKQVEIKNAGINGDTLEKYEEIDKDMPELPERYKHIHSGKVRETYENPDNPNQLFIVATDRISTHDVVHQSLIKGKGKALTSISDFWFNELKNNSETSDIKTQMEENPIWPKDFPKELKEKTTIVKKLKALPIEAIVRGYLYGSVLKGYNSETGELSTGQFVGKGLQKCSKFYEPMFTPSTKGETDININFDNMHKELAPWLIENGYENINAKKLAEQIKEISLKIYKFAQEKALEKGDILGDTKFEFGLNEKGELVLIDEILTPDSSRYWKAETFKEGEEPDSSDKQYVRDQVSKIWKDKPRTDGKKYPVKLDKEVVDNTKIIYAGMNVKYQK